MNINYELWIINNAYEYKIWIGIYEVWIIKCKYKLWLMRYGYDHEYQGLRLIMNYEILLWIRIMI